MEEYIVTVAIVIDIGFAFATKDTTKVIEAPNPRAAQERIKEMIEEVHREDRLLKGDEVPETIDIYFGDPIDKQGFYIGQPLLKQNLSNPQLN
jgi:hypothetical protein